MGALAIMRSKWFVGGLAGLAVVVTLYLGYRHYTGLLDEVELLQARQAQQDLALDIEREAVVSLRGNIEEWKQAQDDLVQTIEEMQDEANEARAEARRLRQLFAELDFSGMSSAAVDSVATGIVDRLWGLIESASDPGRYGGRDSTAVEAEAAGPGADRAGEAGLDSDPDRGGPGAGPDGGAVPDPGD